MTKQYQGSICIEMGCSFSLELPDTATEEQAKELIGYLADYTSDELTNDILKDAAIDLRICGSEQLAALMGEAYIIADLVHRASFVNELEEVKND